MGLKTTIQFLIFLLGLLFYLGICVKEPENGSQSKSSLQKSLLPHRTENASVHEYENKHASNREEQKILPPNRILFTETELQSSNAMPELDVVTPITTVPVINPTNPTITNPTYDPTYNPLPTPSNPTNTITTPTTNPTPTMGSPSTPIMGSPSTPTMGSPSTPTMGSSPSSGQSWCIASQTASQTTLQVALDYACGYGADCSAIQQGGNCYNPNTLRDHASYAFNDYYQKNPTPTSCDFGGTAIITNIDPSTPTCPYPSTSTSSSVLNTTNPTGSTVFGSVPPSTSGAASVSVSLPLVTLARLLKSLVYG